MVLSADDAQLFYLVTSLPENKDISILDAGCGDGRYSQYLMQQGYSNVVAVDLFEKLPIDSIPYQTASIDDLPFENEAFDFIFSNSVVYYIDPPRRAIAELARVLKPGGSLLLTAHTKWSSFTLQRMIKRDFFKNNTMSHLSGVKFYSARYYQRALQLEGFKVLVRDGWRFSFFAYPIYLRASRIFKEWFRLRLPEIRPNLSRWKWMGKIRSELSYHCVFVAQKR